VRRSALVLDGGVVDHLLHRPADHERPAPSRTFSVFLKPNEHTLVVVSRMHEGLRVRVAVLRQPQRVVEQNCQRSRHTCRKAGLSQWRRTDEICCLHELIDHSSLCVVRRIFEERADQREVVRRLRAARRDYARLLSAPSSSHLE
jgi:hypothetical protein